MDELEVLHATIHAEHRRDISNLHWDLVQAKAREKVKDLRIAELEGLLEQATRPDACDITSKPSKAPHSGAFRMPGGTHG